MRSKILVVTCYLPLYCFSPGMSRTTMWRKVMPARTCWIDVQSWEVFLKSLSGLWCIPVIMVLLFIPGCRDIDRVHAAPLDRSQKCSGKHFISQEAENNFAKQMHMYAQCITVRRHCMSRTNGAQLKQMGHDCLSAAINICHPEKFLFYSS